MRYVIDGVNGMLEYFICELRTQGQVVFFDYDESDRFDLNDGLLVARKLLETLIIRLM